MTRAEILMFLRTKADALGLRDWTIELSDMPADPEHEADIDFDEHKRTAVLRVCSGFSDLTLTEQRGLLVHELAHLVLDPIDAVIDQACEAMRSAEARKMLRTAYDAANERVAWALARAVVGI